ncbi:GNAT family N-acetyltransferase [Chloroflexota bacterium]
MTDKAGYKFIVRPGSEQDYASCIALDHSSTGDYVWQVEVQETPANITYNFRTVRLPRTMTIVFPQDSQALLAAWPTRDCYLVAENEAGICGYTSVQVDSFLGICWIRELVVARGVRRRRIGSALLQEVAKWSKANGFKRITTETQTKNYAAIAFCQRHGLVFCGFNDRYYPNQDIAVFFTLSIR